MLNRIKSKTTDILMNKVVTVVQGIPEIIQVGTVSYFPELITINKIDGEITANALNYRTGKIRYVPLLEIQSICRIKKIKL